MRTLLVLVSGIFGLWFLAEPQRAQAQPLANSNVGVCLIIAIDISSSVTPERYDIQKNGYMIAFTDPDVVNTIVASGGIAVQMITWGGRWQQEQSAWFVITDHDSAVEFADYIASTSRKYDNGSTYLGDALALSIESLRTSPYTCAKKVIDISGDGRGRDDTGHGATKNVPLAISHEQAAALNITINGLPIMGSESDIADYYRDEVIFGETSFIEIVTDPDDVEAFTASLIRKLLRELNLS